MSSPVRRACIVLFVSAVTAAGCSGKSDSEVSACRGELVDEANAAVVSQFYAEGRLGTQRQVERQLGKYGKRFFRPDGSLRPYRGLSPLLKGDFNVWMYSGHAFDVTRAAQKRATAQAFERAKKQC